MRTPVCLLPPAALYISRLVLVQSPSAIRKVARKHRYIYGPKAAIFSQGEAGGGLVGGRGGREGEITGRLKKGGADKGEQGEGNFSVGHNVAVLQVRMLLNDSTCEVCVRGWRNSEGAWEGKGLVEQTDGGIEKNMGMTWRMEEGRGKENEMGGQKRRNSRYESDRWRPRP